MGKENEILQFTHMGGRAGREKMLLWQVPRMEVQDARSTFDRVIWFSQDTREGTSTIMTWVETWRIRIEKGENFRKRKEHVSRSCGMWGAQKDQWGTQREIKRGKEMQDEAGGKLKARQDGVLEAMLSSLFSLTGNHWSVLSRELPDSVWVFQISFCFYRSCSSKFQDPTPPPPKKVELRTEHIH